MCLYVYCGIFGGVATYLMVVLQSSVSDRPGFFGVQRRRSTPPSRPPSNHGSFKLHQIHTTQPARKCSSKKFADVSHCPQTTVQFHSCLHATEHYQSTRSLTRSTIHCSIHHHYPQSAIHTIHSTIHYPLFPAAPRAPRLLRNFSLTPGTVKVTRLRPAQFCRSGRAVLNTGRRASSSALNASWPQK